MSAEVTDRSSPPSDRGAVDVEALAETVRRALAAGYDGSLDGGLRGTADDALDALVAEVGRLRGEREAKPRCWCHREAGDSPCPTHGGVCATCHAELAVDGDEMTTVCEDCERNDLRDTRAGRDAALADAAGLRAEVERLRGDVARLRRALAIADARRRAGGE